MYVNLISASETDIVLFNQSCRVDASSVEPRGIRNRVGDNMGFTVSPKVMVEDCGSGSPDVVHHAFLTRCLGTRHHSEALGIFDRLETCTALFLKAFKMIFLALNDAIP